MSKGKVAVIGLAGQSAFLTAEHFPNPGETISCSSLFFEPGGKGYNQAIACARMGVQTVFIGAVGNDAGGEECRRALEREGILTCLVKKKVPTAYAVITTIPDGENTVEVFSGAARELDVSDLYEEAIQKELKECDYLLLQNELSADCLKASLELAKELNLPVILNPAPADQIPAGFLSRCQLITPNYGEACALAGFTDTDKPSEQELMEAFHKKNIKKAVITLGGQGSLLIDETGYQKIPVFSYGTAVDTTGAGDTFNGTLTAGLALGETLENAVRLAAIAAGIGVTRKGAAGSIPQKDEVMKYFKQ